MSAPAERRRARGRGVILAGAVLFSLACKPAMKGAGSQKFPADGTFEGTLSLDVTSAKQHAALRYAIKGDKMRVQGTGSETYVVIDWAVKKGYTISDHRRMALPMDLNRMAARMKAGPRGSKVPTLAPTGRTETVAGYDCEELEIAEGDKSITSCAVRGIGWFGGHGPGSLPFVDPDIGKLFPLRMIQRDASGAELVRAEASAIERKPVDDATFRIPEGYRIIGVSDDAPSPG